MIIFAKSLSEKSTTKKLVDFSDKLFIFSVKKISFNTKQ